MEDKRKTDLAFKLLDNIQNLIKFADTKVNVLLVISGVTTSFILTNFKYFFDTSLFSETMLGLYFIVFIIFLGFSIFTIFSRSDQHTGNSVPKTIFFEHIATRVEVKDFTDEYSKIDEKIFLEDLLYQVFENSKIASKKFKFYRKSLIAISFQIFLFCILIIIKFFA